MARRLWFAGAVSVSVALALCAGACREGRAADAEVLEALREREAQRRYRFHRELRELIAWCEESGLREEAEQGRRFLATEQGGDVLELGVLPEEEIGGPPRNASAEQKQWFRRFYRARGDFASDLFSLASRAVKAGQISYAYDLVHEIAELDPDHRNARTLLGYVKYRGKWVTPFQRERLGDGWVQHERFGWIEERNVRRYEQGLRPYDGKWIKADAEARLRRDLRNGWQVRTEHYVVVTNHSLEAGVELGRRLEDLYRVFHRVFAGFFTPREQVARMFEGRGRVAASGSERPFQVVYFRDREEYMAQETLRSILGRNLDISAGAYVPQLKTAFFFYDPQGDGTTVLHEGTHQLFSESRGPASLVGREANFWIVEGIACYMESLVRQGDRLRIGGRDAGRFRDARYRLETGYHIPLAELTGWGIQRFQSQADLRPLYSESAGLAHFLMHYDAGRYRQPLVDYLQAIYTQRDTPQTLSQLTGTAYRQLDKEYRGFLDVGR